MPETAPQPTRSLYTIPAGVPFAAALVDGLKSLAMDPGDLARAIVLLPSRRAARALRLAFLAANGETAMLLPRMVPIGDVEADDPVLQDHEPGMSAALSDDPAAIPTKDTMPPPAINPLRRQMHLARLLEGFALGGQKPSFGQAMMLARSLGDLLDQLATVGAEVGDLRDLLPSRFSQHWQDILKLLNILIDRWPDILAAEGVMDLAARREWLARLRLQAWQAQPPQGLVVIAGSTGTFASTRDLIGCVSQLPRGYVVLPGLDVGADHHWPAIVEDAGHPQHQLARLLAHLEMSADKVRLWPGCDDANPVAAARRELMREVFAPAQMTSRWRQLAAERPELGADCLQGLEIINCPDMQSEANLVALSLRETLETPGKTAALITPDRTLAEAVVTALRRWDIHVDDSAGTPLSRCPAGWFLQLLANALVANFAPVPLLALLKHPLAAGGLAPADFRSKIRRLERVALRGHRPPAGLSGLHQAVKDDPELAHFVTAHIAAPLADVTRLWGAGAPPLATLASAVAIAAERLAAQSMNADGTQDSDDGARHLWDDFDGEAAATVMRDLGTQASDVGVDPAEFPQILAQLFAQTPVRRQWPLHPRLAVLGPVEARMQTADRLILAGFNEGNWPPRPAADPWMNGEMRQAVGLPPWNWRTGLSAHDVYMAICAPEVIVTRALRQEDAATTPSRWLQRFEAVLTSLGLSGALNDGSIRLDWMAHLTPTPPLRPITRPMPAPPVKMRPRQFSATEIDSWIADPYHIYAKKILRLRQLDPLDRLPDAALRGNLVHESLALFIKKFPDGMLPDNALGELENIGRTVFAAQWHHASVQYFWWPRFMTVAAWFITQEQDRRKTLARSHAEIKGQLTLDGPAGEVIFTARADRIDQDEEGGLDIIDYKTGGVPSRKQVAEGRRTQLLVESVIAAGGGFVGVSGGQINSMEYWHLTGRKGQIATQTNVMPTDWAPDATLALLTRLVAQFDDPETAYASEPDRKYALPFSPYKHLARVAEWQAEDDHE